MHNPSHDIVEATRALRDQIRRAATVVLASSLALAKDSGRALRDAARTAWRASASGYNAAVETVAELLFLVSAFIGPVAGIASYFAFHFVPGLVIGCAWLAFIGVAVLAYRKKLPVAEVRSRPRWLTVVGHTLVVAALLVGPVVLAVKQAPRLQTLRLPFRKVVKIPGRMSERFSDSASVA